MHLRTIRLDDNPVLFISATILRPFGLLWDSMPFHFLSSFEFYFNLTPSSNHILQDSGTLLTFVLCNRCQVAVHEECYGVKASESVGSWVCRACETPDIERDCCLCPVKGQCYALPEFAPPTVFVLHVMSIYMLEDVSSSSSVYRGDETVNYQYFWHLFV